VLRPLAGGHDLQEWSVAVNTWQVVNKAPFFSSEVGYEVISLLNREFPAVKYAKAPQCCMKWSARNILWRFEDWSGTGKLLTSRFLIENFVCIIRTPSGLLVTYSVGRAIAQVVIRRLPTATARVRVQVRSCGICVEHNGIVAGFLRYFGFLWQFSFHRLLRLHHNLSSGAGSIGQLVADVPSGLSLTPPQENEKKKLKYYLLG
jgi:hypothetical protein